MDWGFVAIVCAPLFALLVCGALSKWMDGRKKK